MIPFRWQNGKYMCFYCRSLFMKSSKLKEHTNTEHQKAIPKDVTIRTLYRSGRIKLDAAEISCTNCEMQLSDYAEYIDHLSTYHGLDFDQEVTESFDCFHLDDEGMGCLDCGEHYRFFGPLLAHVYKNHIKQLICETCGQGVVGKHNMYHHVQQKHVVKSCKYCDESYPTQYALAKHVEKVHSAGKWKCPMCPEILANSYLKKRHMALVHDCKSSQYVCELCSKMFTRNNKYVQHKLRVHFKERNYSCDQCGYKAFSTDALKDHMVCHDERRPFKCDVCDKTFRRQKNLAIHMKLHK